LQPVRTVLRALGLRQMDDGQFTPTVGVSLGLSAKAVWQIAKRYQQGGLGRALFDGVRYFWQGLPSAALRQSEECGEEDPARSSAGGDRAADRFPFALGLSYRVLQPGNCKHNHAKIGPLYHGLLNAHEGDRWNVSLGSISASVFLSSSNEAERFVLHRC